MSKILAKKDLNIFVKSLRNSYHVFMAVKKGRDFLISEVNDEISKIEQSLTINSVKQIFYPAKDILFKFEQGEPSQTRNNKLPIAAIGLGRHDINALGILDKVMSRPRDKNYWQKRHNSLIIGFGNGISDITGPYDLFFIDAGNNFAVATGSQLGKKITRKSCFKNSPTNLKNNSPTSDPLLADTERLARAITASLGDKIWDELAKICFACGNCAYVCPLCYCFDIKDEIILEENICAKNCSGCSGERWRHWDSCMRPHFFEAAGHNFKPKLSDRIYNWFYHKFVRFPLEFDTIGCVDCGRCIKYCPAKINYREVLEKVLVRYGE